MVSARLMQELADAELGWGPSAILDKNAIIVCRERGRNWMVLNYWCSSERCSHVMERNLPITSKHPYLMLSEKGKPNI